MILGAPRQPWMAVTEGGWHQLRRIPAAARWLHFGADLLGRNEPYSALESALFQRKYGTCHRSRTY